MTETTTVARIVDIETGHADVPDDISQRYRALTGPQLPDLEELDEDYHYIEFSDGRGSPATAHQYTGHNLNGPIMYACDDSSCDLRLDDVERTEEFTQFLIDLKGRDYYIEGALTRQQCSPKVIKIYTIAFAEAADLAAFEAQFEWPKVISKSIYSQAEAVSEKARIEAIGVAKGWSMRRAAAFKGHVTRRTVAK